MACFWRSGMPLATDKKNYPEWFYIVFKDLLLDGLKASLGLNVHLFLQNKIIKKFELRMSARRKRTDTVPALQGAKTTKEAGESGGTGLVWMSGMSHDGRESHQSGGQLRWDTPTECACLFPDYSRGPNAAGTTDGRGPVSQMRSLSPLSNILPQALPSRRTAPRLRC